LTVGDVVELVGPDGVGERSSMASGLVVVILGVVEGDGWRGRTRGEEGRVSETKESGEKEKREAEAHQGQVEHQLRAS